MTSIAKPIRIEPAFDDAQQIRAMFERHAPYPAVAAYGLDVFVDEANHSEAERSVLPWFRGNWALSGKPLVDGAEVILHNKKFLEAARAVFGTSRVHPEFVVVNVNAPMPAGPTHVDVPSFHGAPRDHYPLPVLVGMGRSGLFEAWRGIQPPFGNVALIADNGRMYHRIGAIGDPNAELPRISASAHIQPDGDGNWVILENGKIRATYPTHEIRLSVVWKAAVRDGELSTDNLTLDRIMAIFRADLRHRSVDFEVPSDPLADTAWILLLQRIYGGPTDSGGKQ